MRRSLIALAGAVILAALIPRAAAAEPLRFAWRIGGDVAVMRSDKGSGGAVTSLKFRGQEYIDRRDHGRELQAAIWLYEKGGVINPTQAGSCHDTRTAGSSRLLSSDVGDGRYATRTDMAIWWLHAYKCAGSAYRKIIRDKAPILSGTVHGQVMTPGYQGLANAVLTEISFTTPQAYDRARVEALTAYMPPAFNRFFLFDVAAGTAAPHPFGATDDAEQDHPVIAATPDGRHAMAVLSLTTDPKPRYNGFIFADSSKWNLVFYPPQPFAAGTHDYRAVWVIGTLDEVTASLRVLTAK